MVKNANSGVRTKLTTDEYLQRLCDLVTPAVVTEIVPVRQCLTRVLATDVSAQLAIPPFTNSAMDGFAVRVADGSPLPVVGAVFAGSLPTPLAPGTALKIMTGAPLPTGADAVVPIEDCQEADGLVRFTAPPRLGQHIRLAGEDRRPGDTLIAKGTLLAARHLAAAAAAGSTELPVAGRPRVAIIVTGDEVTPTGAGIGPGRLPDSNGPFLEAAVTAVGCATTLTHGRDDASALKAVLDEVASADLIVLTGGASVGDRDVARDVLSEAGGHFVHVAMQPGKPQGYGHWGGTPVIALPGNPVSVAVSWAVFVRPVLLAMLGQTPDAQRWCTASQPWDSPAGRRQYMPVALTENAQGHLQARPATPGGSASHYVGSLAMADGLAVVPEQTTQVQPSDVLQLLDLA